MQVWSGAEQAAKMHGSISLSFVQCQSQHRPSRDQIRPAFDPPEHVVFLGGLSIVRVGILPIRIIFIHLINGGLDHVIRFIFFIATFNGTLVILGIFLDPPLSDDISERRPFGLQSTVGVSIHLQIVLAEALRQGTLCGEVGRT